MKKVVIILILASVLAFVIYKVARYTLVTKALDGHSMEDTKVNRNSFSELSFKELKDEANFATTRGVYTKSSLPSNTYKN